MAALWQDAEYVLPAMSSRLQCLMRKSGSRTLAVAQRGRERH